MIGVEVLITKGGNGTSTDGLGGHDTLRSSIDGAIGTPFIDRLIGDDSRTEFHGLGGNDFIDGRGGDDLLTGGEGDDTILGGDGNDIIEGGDGFDTIQAGKGDDTVSGGAGNDQIEGGAGDDQIEGGAGDDQIDGGEGDDSISGGEGNDQINGGAGNDDVSGGAGDDQIDGGEGDDSISGGEGNDQLDGGEGNDTLSGDEGDDVVNGGAGNDLILWNAGDGSDMMDGGEGDGDRLEIRSGDALVLAVSAPDSTTLTGVDGTPFSITFKNVEDVHIDANGGNDHMKMYGLEFPGVQKLFIDMGDGDDVFIPIAPSLPPGVVPETRIIVDGGPGEDYYGAVPDPDC